MATQTIMFDKLAFVATLEKRGFSRAQSEAVAEAVADIALANLVSKADLQVAVSELCTELRKEIADLRFDILKYMFSAMAAQTALIVALVELLK